MPNTIGWNIGVIAYYKIFGKGVIKAIGINKERFGGTIKINIAITVRTASNLRKLTVNMDIPGILYMNS